MADVILLSTADWDHPLWTNKQHQALSLAEAGHRVLYIDSLGVRGARATRSDSSRILRRLSRSLWPLRRVHPGGGDQVWQVDQAAAAEAGGAPGIQGDVRQGAHRV